MALKTVFLSIYNPLDIIKYSIEWIFEFLNRVKFQTIIISLILIPTIILNDDIYSLNSILNQIDLLVNFPSNIFSHGITYRYLIS